MFGGMMGGNTPAISQRQAEKYYEMLGLTAEQKEAAGTLFEAYQDAARDVQEGVQSKMEDVRAEFQETRDPSVWGGMREIMQKARAERTKLDEGFFADLGVLLTPEQASGIGRVERAFRRENGARQGLMSGERVDLVSMVDEAEVREKLGEARPKLDEMLSLYEEEMDRAIKQRDEVRAKIAESFQEVRQSGDQEKMNALIADGREASARVRDVNRKFARQMSASLEGEAKELFEKRFKEQSFPDVYRPTRAARALDAAMGLNDLTPEQKTQVEELKASYTRAMGPLNEKLAKATEENEETLDAAGLMRMFGGGAQEGPLADARRERREEMNSTTEKLRKILTPEQIDRLPTGNDDEGGEGGPRRQRRGGQGGEGGGRRPAMDGV
jgi:Spy/CpxP family protein refolding chaperone